MVKPRFEQVIIAAALVLLLLSVLTDANESRKSKPRPSTRRAKTTNNSTKKTTKDTKHVQTTNGTSKKLNSVTNKRNHSTEKISTRTRSDYWPLSIKWPKQTVSNSSDGIYKTDCSSNSVPQVFISRNVTSASLEQFVSSKAIKHLVIITDSLTCCDASLDQVTLFNVTIIANTVRITGPNTVQDCCIVALSVVLQAQNLTYNSLFGERLDVSVVHNLHRNVLISKLLRVTTSGTQAEAQRNILIAEYVRFASDRNETGDFDASEGYFNFQTVHENVYVFKTGEIGTVGVQATSAFTRNSVVGQNMELAGYVTVNANKFVTVNCSLNNTKKNKISWEENSYFCSTLKFCHFSQVKNSTQFYCSLYIINSTNLPEQKQFADVSFASVWKAEESYSTKVEEKLIGFQSFSIFESNRSEQSKTLGTSNFWVLPLSILQGSQPVVFQRFGGTNQVYFSNFRSMSESFNLDAAFTVNNALTQLVQSKTRNYSLAAVVKTKTLNLQWLDSVLPHNNALSRQAQNVVSKLRKNRAIMSKQVHFNCTSQCELRNLILVAGSVKFQLDTIKPPGHNRLILQDTIIVAENLSINASSFVEVFMTDTFVFAGVFNLSLHRGRIAVVRCQILSTITKMNKTENQTVSLLIKSSSFISNSVELNSGNLMVEEADLFVKDLKINSSFVAIADLTLLSENVQITSRTKLNLKKSCVYARWLKIDANQFGSENSEFYANQFAIFCNRLAITNFTDAYVYGEQFVLDNLCNTKNSIDFASVMAVTSKEEEWRSRLSFSVNSAVTHAIHKDHNEVLEVSVEENAEADPRTAINVANFFELPGTLLQVLADRLKYQCFNAERVENYKLSTSFVSLEQSDERADFIFEVADSYSLQQVAQAMAATLEFKNCVCEAAGSKSASPRRSETDLVGVLVHLCLLLNLAIFSFFAALAFKRFVEMMAKSIIGR